VRAALADLVAALVSEAAATDESGAGDPDAATDLQWLAAQTRFSRYQALRVFKRRHGVPPHAYQLLARIALAQRALRAGLPAADVAVDQGFVDQSHFTRQFKQFVGVTPVQYARAADTLQSGTRHRGPAVVFGGA
jgi:AraC-like DNA-binding protein